jgi:iron-sulfur cluster repair protein YtfE (RIC family)
MQEDDLDRLKRDHERLAAKVRVLLARVARRPLSLLALRDTLALLDTELAVHEREEESKLFPRFGAATDPLETLVEAHARIDKGRRVLRDHLANWDAPRPGALDAEALACQVEELLHTVLEQFAEEERQIFNLARAHPKAAADAAQAASAKAAKTTKKAKTAKADKSDPPSPDDTPEAKAARAGA